MLGFKTYIAEAKATPCGRCGTTHVAPKDGGKCPALEGTNTADKKPENYVAPDGKVRTRMVPAKKDIIKTEDNDPCWDTHKQVGMKKKNGKEVPNCVPKESVDEKKELTFRIHKDGKPMKKGGKTTEIYGIAKAKKMVDDLKKKHRGSKFTAHHVYKDGDDLDESVDLDEQGVLSKSAFKRKEHEFEAELDRKNDAKVAAKRRKLDGEKHHIYINKKVWKKNGKPVEFANKRHATSAASAITKKDPKKAVTVTHHTTHTAYGDTIK